MPDGVTQAYVYDNGGHGDLHVTSITYKDGTTAIGNLTYSGACPERSRRDPDGRRSTVGGTLAGINIPLGYGCNNTYDADNEMTQYCGFNTGVVPIPTYDQNGQMTFDGFDT